MKRLTNRVCALHENLKFDYMKLLLRLVQNAKKVMNLKLLRQNPHLTK